jgi:hypothetical protein
MRRRLESVRTARERGWHTKYQRNHLESPPLHIGGVVWPLLDSWRMSETHGLVLYTSLRLHTGSSNHTLTVPVHSEARKGDVEIRCMGSPSMAVSCETLGLWASSCERSDHARPQREPRPNDLVTLGCVLKWQGMTYLTLSAVSSMSRYGNWKVFRALSELYLPSTTTERKSIALCGSTCLRESTASDAKSTTAKTATATWTFSVLYPCGPGFLLVILTNLCRLSTCISGQCRRNGSGRTL